MPADLQRFALYACTFALHLVFFLQSVGERGGSPQFCVGARSAPTQNQGSQAWLWGVFTPSCGEPAWRIWKLL